MLSGRVNGGGLQNGRQGGSEVEHADSGSLRHMEKAI